MTQDERELAQVAYDAYAAHQDWTTSAGVPMVLWEDVRPEIQSAWRAAVRAVLEVEGG